MSTETERSSASWSPSDSSVTTRPPGAGFVIFAGIVLPTLAIVVEAYLRLCTMFFDPFPTNMHLALLALVPVSNAFAIWAWRRHWAVRPATFLVGASVGVAFVYSVIFLPVTPISFFGIMCMGIGFLGFSPFLALAASLLNARRLKPQQSSMRTGRVLTWIGVVVGMLPLVAYMILGHVTTVGLRMAASKDEARSLQGVNLLRHWGSKRAMLRACYELPNDLWLWTWIAGSVPGQNVQRDQARAIYYRVTGDPFNSVPAPNMAGPRTRAVDDSDIDSDIGGTAVNGVVRHLALSQSHMDSTIDRVGQTCYTQWTMQFSNSAAMGREARAEIALPPGGVVSRLTLWVNGKPREAVFGNRGRARQAYQTVAIAQHRDPVLVTTCGPDRVLLQCFPVPAGGKMKVRLGITSPILVDCRTFTPPHIVECNFAVPEKLRDAMVPNAASRRVAETVQRRARMSTLAVHGSGYRCWTPDPTDRRYCITEEKFTDMSRPDQVVVVVDSSVRLHDLRKQIAADIAKLPPSCRFALLRAGDQVTELAPMRAATAANLRKAADAIENAEYCGGIDNRPALLRAYKMAACGRSAIIWIHGPQPFAFDTRTQRLLNLYHNRSNAPALYAVAASDGRNGALADLETTGRIWKLSSLAEFRGLLAQWNSGGGQTVAVRKRVPIASVSGTRVSQDLAKLWAYDQVMANCRAGHFAQAQAIAVRYGLVTPVTGAVVLETDQQYADAGLKPGKPSFATPEPAAWVILGFGALLIFLGYVRRAHGSRARL